MAEGREICPANVELPGKLGVCRLKRLQDFRQKRLPEL